MRLLLTSSGISNTSIHNALVDLLANRLPNPTPSAFPTRRTARAAGELQWPTSSSADQPSVPCADWVGSRWECWSSPRCLASKKSIGVPTVQEADALLVWGGDVLYLCHWMRQSGLADLLPSLHETVYVGVSSGSMVLTPNFGEAYDDWFCREPPASDLPAGDDRALGLVDFSLFPHLDHERSPQNSLANAERWAARIPVPTYAIDDQSAIKVTDGAVEVVTEGH